MENKLKKLSKSFNDSVKRQMHPIKHGPRAVFLTMMESNKNLLSESTSHQPSELDADGYNKAIPKIETIDEEKSTEDEIIQTHKPGFATSISSDSGSRSLQDSHDDYSVNEDKSIDSFTFHSHPQQLQHSDAFNPNHSISQITTFDVSSNSISMQNQNIQANKWRKIHVLQAFDAAEAAASLAAAAKIADAAAKVEAAELEYSHYSTLQSESLSTTRYLSSPFKSLNR
jgi:hypothetical protein